MFSKSHRFSFKKGVPKNYYQTPLFVIRYDKNTTGSFKCAVVVGKKVDKRAVVRNKIKRQTVEIIKELVAQDKNVAIVLYAKKPTLEAGLEQRKDILAKAFDIIGITK